MECMMQLTASLQSILTMCIICKDIIVFEKMNKSEFTLLLITHRVAVVITKYNCICVDTQSQQACSIPKEWYYEAQTILEKSKLN